MRRVKCHEEIVQSLGCKRFILSAFVLLTPGLAQANAGVPMLFLVMPAFAIALVPIILVEGFYLSKKLVITPSQTAKTVTLSNLASTVVGIPLTWLILVAVQISTGGGSAYGLDTLIGKILAVTWQAPWLIPYEQDLGWMIPVAGIVLLVPFFFASWWVEFFVSKKLLKEISTEMLKPAVRNANLISYCLLVIWPLVMLLLNHGTSE
ncbi:MAG: hypothetical protein HKN34_03215 [Gammaproteobacteria bacterium]|nr:hypothetical protein [Gammaproteobacteria bacterium]